MQIPNNNEDLLGRELVFQFEYKKCGKKNKTVKDSYYYSSGDRYFEEVEEGHKKHAKTNKASINMLKYDIDVCDIYPNMHTILKKSSPILDNIDPESKYRADVEQMQIKSMYIAKSKENGEWILGALDSSSGDTAINTLGGRHIECDPETLCGYAGTTVNGAMLFENDVLYLSKTFDGTDPYYGKIEYDTENSCMVITSNHGSVPLTKALADNEYRNLDGLPENLYRFEGNTIDDPELIKLIGENVKSENKDNLENFELE